MNSLEELLIIDPKARKPRKPRKPARRFLWQRKGFPWEEISRWNDLPEAQAHRPDKPGTYQLIEYYGRPKHSDGSLWDEITIE